MSDLVEHIQAACSPITVDISSDILTVTVAKQDLLSTVKQLTTDDKFGFTFLTDLCGIHHPDSSPPTLGVVYHLHNLRHNQRIRLKTFTPVTDPTIPSLTSLFSSADWMERETYDFFGIQFEGHPNLKRILNMDDMDYFPLRKEYALEDSTREDKQDDYFGR